MPRPHACQTATNAHKFKRVRAQFGLCTEGKQTCRRSHKMSGEWTNEDIFFFLECYQSKPCIWDPSNKDHKDKKKVADAWSRLSKSLNKPVKELKAKKEILMVTFRKNLKKKQDCIRSNAGIEGIYEPSWFAYNLMESFLLPIYTVKLGINSETKSTETQIVPENKPKIEIEDVENIQTELKRRNGSDNESTQTESRSRDISNCSNPNFDMSNVYEDDEECELYARLLAKKLKRYPVETRHRLMYAIDGLLLDNPYP